MLRAWQFNFKSPGKSILTFHTLLIHILIWHLHSMNIRLDCICHREKISWQDQYQGKYLSYPPFESKFWLSDNMLSRSIWMEIGLATNLCEYCLYWVLAFISWLVHVCLTNLPPSLQYILRLVAMCFHQVFHQDLLNCHHLTVLELIKTYWQDQFLAS